MSSVDVRRVTRTAILIALTVAFQSLGLQQMVTGPVVNMFLYLAVMIVGIWGGVATGLITPAVALWVGILKPAMAPMVFPIMISNAALAVTFGLVSGIGGRKSTTFRIIGILIASFVKFLILSTTVKYLVQVPGPLAKMMQGTQLATALIGGALALILIEILSRTGMFSETTGGTGRS
ncbi:MAG TPA: ECF transporter S component [Bacillota bacterium]|nr:ECF transporter S component [Bacillota bacterium]